MAVTKNVAVVAMFVMAAFVSICSATDLSNLYVWLSDSANVEVFKGVTESNENQLAGFGEGQVFDYDVTTKPGGFVTQLARAQGLFYRSSNLGKVEVYKEEFTILFLESGAYSGTSFSFSGIWVAGSVHEFPIIGGTGDLVGIKGIATLTWSGTGDAYKLTVNKNTGSHFHSRLRA
eukprot:TRINITY_DN58_c0_g2_i1.p1 TRINITY_DN58_c0_g2~~TRINITY_DN58_c0_g2_i1.p1  ORF type:complete len:176 (-),score=10.32 TRINITY_DN58_c0_g2_i1:596-1123(-)